MNFFDPRLMRYAKAAKNYIILIAITGILSAALIIAQDIFIATIISPVINDYKPLTFVAIPLVWLTTIFLLRASIFLIRERHAHRAATGAIKELRTKVLKHALQLGPRWNSSHANNTVTTVNRGLADLGPYFSQYLPQLILALTVTPLTLIVMFIVDPLSAFMTLMGIVMIPVFMILIGKLTEEVSKRRLGDMQSMGRQVLDLVAGLATLKALGRETGPSTQVEKVSQSYNRSTFATLKIAFISGSVLEFITTLSVAIVAVEMGWRMVAGHVDLFTGLLVIMLAPEIFEPIRQVGKHFHASADGMAAAQNAFEILELPLPKNGTLRAPDLKNSIIRVTNLSVAARGNWAPNQLSFELKAGEITVLTGASGNGKSTTAYVLLGVLTADEGKVEIITGQECTNLYDINIESWWKQCSWIPQTPVLVPGTIAQNLDIDSKNIEQSLLDAAKATGFDQVVASLEQGWDTVIGQGGVGLSVGQRQRLALTRVLYHPSQLVILDEPTAHLDAGLDNQVNNAITELKNQGRTVLVIAHRNSTAQRGDKIVEVTSSGFSPQRRPQAREQVEPEAPKDEKPPLEPLFINIDRDLEASK